MLHGINQNTQKVSQAANQTNGKTVKQRNGQLHRPAHSLSKQKQTFTITRKGITRQHTATKSLHRKPFSPGLIYRCGCTPTLLFAIRHIKTSGAAQRCREMCEHRGAQSEDQVSRYRQAVQSVCGSGLQEGADALRGHLLEVERHGGNVGGNCGPSAITDPSPAVWP